MNALRFLFATALIALTAQSTAWAQTSKSKTAGKSAAKSAGKSNGDWPCWRGPNHDGISLETGLLHAWPADGPKLLWKVEGLGEGFSTPSVAGKLIYTMGNRDGQEFVIALDKTAQGKEAWATALGPVRHGGGGYPGPRSTPTVDGKQVYALGLNGDLACLDAATGKILWGHNLPSEYGGKTPNWGYSESVLIDGPWVLCTPGGDKATLAAFLKTTGRPVWGSPINDTPGYASIVPAQIGGVKQYVQFMSSGVVSVNARDGRPLWKYTNPANGTANISTPLVQGNAVFAASGYGTGGGLYEIGRNDAREVYFTKEMKNHHGGMILLDGVIYGANESILTCLDFKTGETKWQSRNPGKCSLIYADGLLICRSEQGKVTLVEATPKEYRELGAFEQPDRSNREAWAHPVISEGLLYLQDQGKLLCYDLRDPGK